MPLPSDRITVILFVRNEQERVELALRNFLGLFPIHVIDNESTDGTAEIVRRMGVPITRLRNPGFIECDEVMGPVQELCRTDFLLVAFAGEFLPRSLLSAYAEAAQSGRYDVVRAYRYSVTAGTRVPIATSPRVRYPGELRLFRKGSVSFQGNRIHDVGRPVVPAERILELGPAEAVAFLQFRDYDASQNEETNRRYNDVWARQRFEAGERFGLARCLVCTLAKFANPYFRHGAWRYGLVGFFQASFRAIMEFQVHARLWEHERRLLKPDVQALHRRMREDLLAAQGFAGPAPAPASDPPR